MRLPLGAERIRLFSDSQPSAHDRSGHIQDGGIRTQNEVGVGSQDDARQLKGELVGILVGGEFLLIERSDGELSDEPGKLGLKLLGVDADNSGTFGDALTTLLSPASTPNELEEARRASDTVVSMLGELVETKQRYPDDRLVSALIAARDGDHGLNHQEPLSTIFQLIVAGHETTASLIGSSIVSLLRYPDQLAFFKANPEQVPSAIEELLCYDAPVPHSTFRYAVEDVELGGATIPAGSQVIICLASANQDTSWCPHGESLDVSTPDTRHLAFGHGIHFCLGAGLARMEAQLALSSLFLRFPDLCLAEGDCDLSWGHRDGLVLRGLTRLRVLPGTAIESSLIDSPKDSVSRSIMSGLARSC